MNYNCKTCGEICIVKCGMVICVKCGHEVTKDKADRDNLLELLRKVKNSYIEPLKGTRSACVGYNIKVDKETFDLIKAAIALADPKD